jgi:hypothetical protein
VKINSYVLCNTAGNQLVTMCPNQDLNKCYFHFHWASCNHTCYPSESCLHVAGWAPMGLQYLHCSQQEENQHSFCDTQNHMGCRNGHLDPSGNHTEVNLPSRLLLYYVKSASSTKLQSTTSVNWI